MGFFDFLNPKKAVQNKLMGAVRGDVLSRVGNLKDVGEDQLKDRLTSLIADQMSEKSSGVIPSAMQPYSDKLIDAAATRMTDELIGQVKSQIRA